MEKIHNQTLKAVFANFSQHLEDFQKIIRYVCASYSVGNAVRQNVLVFNTFRVTVSLSVCVHVCLIDCLCQRVSLLV